MTTEDLIERMIAYQKIEPCGYDITDLIARVAMGRILSDGQRRWIETAKAWKKPQSASAMGRKGGKSKSPEKKAASQKNIAAATAVRMKDKTPEERKEQAREAANARWGKKKK